MKKPHKEHVKQTSKGRSEPWLVIGRIDGNLLIRIEIPIRKGNGNGDHVHYIR